VTSAGKRYVDLAELLRTLRDDDPQRAEIDADMEQIWRRLDPMERDEIHGLFIALDEVDRTGMGYPRAKIVEPRAPGDGFCQCGRRLDEPHQHGDDA